ncbi:hypothetical protein VPH35_013738 [Triticum aestivum]|uniref:TF-B3 domain-containing protein n=1 Tax=Aegilops tauschii subsp. strangulata TaxID=200361 RepID=A0A452Y5H1_AEGTS
MCDDPHLEDDRPFVLEKLHVKDRDDIAESTVYLKTKHGFIFKARIYNEIDHTYFGCTSWKGLCKARGFEESMIIIFDIGIFQGTFPHFDQDIWVEIDMIPIFPPCEFLKHTFVK